MIDTNQAEAEIIRSVRNMVADIMRDQTQVWADTTNADEVLVDTCNTFASRLNLTGADKDEFMTHCGLTMSWGIAS